MKKVWKALDILCETLFFLVITYTLSSMYTSFKTHWYAILFLAANIFAIGKYHMAGVFSAQVVTPKAITPTAVNKPPLRSPKSFIRHNTIVSKNRYKKSSNTIQKNALQRLI